MKKLFWLVSLAIAGFWACKTDKTDGGPLTLNVHLDSDADKLNPMLTTSAVSLQVAQRIFLMLAEVDPKTLELKPMLVKAIPVEMPIDTGAYKGGFRYDFEFLPEAKWDDGRPVTGEDFVFTSKLALAGLASPIWRGYQDFVDAIVVDPAEPRRVSVFAKKRYMLAIESMCGTPIMPEHFYDPKGVLKKISLADLKDPKKAAAFSETPEAKALIADFQSPDRAKSPAGLSGCGPYKLEEAVVGQRIVLLKKENWWGQALAERNPLLRFDVKRLVYKPITDRASALSLLKEGGLDVMRNIPPSQFDGLKSEAAAKLDFYAPQVLQYSYLPLNCRRGPLADKRVRQALAHCLDLDAGVKTIMNGYGQRAVGPISPMRSYFDKSLQPIAFDLEKAKALLAEAGWKDSDGDGALDRTLGGKKEPLKLTMLFSPKSEVGKATGLQLQENAKKIGVEIELAPKELNAILEDMKSRSFDIAALQASMQPFADDLYQSWHTKSDAASGNRTGFGNAQSDRLIEQIREERSIARRDELYKAFQKIVYEEQPAIFLFVPTERIAVSKKFAPVISANRPGYYEQYFQLAKSGVPSAN